MASSRVLPQFSIGGLSLAFGLITIWAPAGAQNVCAGSSGQLYLQVQDCRSYIQCSEGQPTQFACPNSTFWNQAASRCDEPKNVTNCGADAKLLKATTPTSLIKPAEMNSGGESNPGAADGGEASGENAANGGEAAEETTAVSGQSELGEEGEEFLPALIGGLISVGKAIGKGVKLADKVNKANKAANNANCVRKNGVRNCLRRSEAEATEARAAEGVASEAAAEVVSDSSASVGAN